jgi:hypothetical protein
MIHAAVMVGRRRNSGTGTASMARAPGSIATDAAGSMAATTAAATAMATTAATAATAATAMCKGDLAGRQMTAKQCDGSSGQRRTNDRRYYEPLQSLWRAFHEQFSFQVYRLVAALLATPSEPAIPLRVKTLQGSRYSTALVRPPCPRARDSTIPGTGHEHRQSLRSQDQPVPTRRTRRLRRRDRHRRGG